MTRAQVIAACIRVVERLRKTAFIPNPRTRYKPGGSTGNMAFNALRYRVEGDRFIVYIDEGIAPYFVYTNEPWTSPVWGGKKNPNEGWADLFAKEFERLLAEELKGEITDVNPI